MNPSSGSFPWLIWIILLLGIIFAFGLTWGLHWISRVLTALRLRLGARLLRRLSFPGSPDQALILTEGLIRRRNLIEKGATSAVYLICSASFLREASTPVAQ